MAKLSARVWENKKLTTQTKVAVYRACIVSTLLFGSESWTTYASQEKRLNIFHIFHMSRILSISWTDKVSSNEVLARANIPSMFTLLRQRRLRWLGHVYQMEDELESGLRPIGRPKLRFKDVCKRDMLATGLPTDNWELHAADRSDWRSVCSLAHQAGEERLKSEAINRRAKRRAEMNKATCVPCWHVSLCAVDVAVSAVLELGFLATRESVCRNCASRGHGPTTAYYYTKQHATNRVSGLWQVRG